MRYMNLKDDKQRDAKVCFEPLYTAKKQKVSSAYQNCRIIKEKNENSVDFLLYEYSYDSLALGNDLLQDDADLDIESTGKFTDSTKKIFLNKDKAPVFNLSFEEHILSPDGQILGKHPYLENESNIQNETLPISCSGLTISKIEAARRYVFTKHYKIRHVNGLTFDFLTEIARRLEAEKLLMFVGAGTNGTEPIVLQKGGKKYRGFLEGRTTENGYLLLLHLTETNLEDYIDE